MTTYNREYHKEYQKLNKEKLKQYNHEYSKMHYQKNKEYYKLKQKRYGFYKRKKQVKQKQLVDYVDVEEFSIADFCN
jgi:hypothetical protein